MDLSKVLKKTKARSDRLEALVKAVDMLPLRIATDDRPYDLDLRPGDGSVQTRRRKQNNQGTEAPRPGDTRGRKPEDQGTEASRPGDTRGRKAKNQGTEAKQPGDGSKTTRGRKVPIIQIPDDVEGSEVVDQGTEAPSEGSTRGRKDIDQGTEALTKSGTRGRKDTDQGTEALTKSGTRGRKDIDQGTEAHQPGDGMDAPKSRVLRPQKEALPRASAQRDILTFLRQSLQVETGSTPYLTVKQIAISCHCTLDTVKKSLQRLKHKQLVATVARSFSCNRGGAVYTVPKIVVRWMDEGAGSDATRGRNAWSDQGTEGDVSSMSLTTTTKPQTAMPPTIGALQLSVTRLRLDTDLRLSANDLVAAQRVNGLSDEEHQASVEHLAFYLRTDEARSIKHPKAFFLSQLRAGYYAPPVDFVSWEEKQLAARVAAQQEKARRLAELHKASFEADFEVWFAELTPQRKAELARQTPFGGMEGPGLKACLREVFSKETGHALPDTSDE